MSRSRCVGVVLAAGLTAFGVSQLTAQRRTAPKPSKVQPITVTTKAQERWADRTLRHLTLEEKIGQMIEVRGIMGFYNADDPSFTQLIGDIRKYHLGAVHLTVNTDGPLLIRTEPYEAAMTTKLLQQEAQGKVLLHYVVCGPEARVGTWTAASYVRYRPRVPIRIRPALSFTTALYWQRM
jgi:hypothetical protein